MRRKEKIVTEFCISLQILKNYRKEGGAQNQNKPIPTSCSELEKT